MDKGLLILVILMLFIKCQKSDERCGIIIQKVEIQTTLYFVLQTDEYINYYNNPGQPNLPDDGVRQGLVTKETYDNFEVGEEYCSEI
jgi:hypothetical protein